MRYPLQIASFLVVILGLSACSNKPDDKETVVTGKVTLDGTLLTMGEVYFQNEDGTASGQGEIGPDGVYRVPSTPLGKVKAAVRTSPYAQYAAKKTKDGKTITMGGRDGNYLAVPKKYEEITSSGLSYTITKDAVINIELSSK